MRIFDGKEYREMTVEEIEETKREEANAAAMERNRPLSQSEIVRMLVAEQINTLAVDDATALRMLAYYPVWESGIAYAEGFKLRFAGNLYKVATAHTSQDDWKPDVATTLFVRIDETHDGSEFDPIPYNGNMVLENGKYYKQNDTLYICTRDTGNPVHHALSALVGVYVEVLR
jgi:hypothetical protein